MNKAVFCFEYIRKNTSQLIFFLTITIFVSLIYSPTSNYDFINYDDHEYVVENQMVNGGITLNGIKWAFFSIHASNWHPVTWLSHMIDCHVWGLNPGMHHITNLVIHILNTLLLFLLFLKSTKQLGPSAFTAAFFALHPMHVETVAWIAERKDVLSTFFMIIAFLYYISYSKNKKMAAYLLSLFFFALGLMSKPMIVTLPFLLLLFDYWPLGRFFFYGKTVAEEGINEAERSQCYNMDRIIYSDVCFLIVEKIPFFILSAVSSYITIIAQKTGGAIVPITVYPVYIRLYNSVIAYFEYIRKMFYPLDLAIPYPYIESFSLPFLGAVFLLLSTLSFLTIFLIKSKPYLAVGWLWFLGTLVPVIGIVQVGAQAMADRYSYIPYTGLFIMIFWIVADLFKKFERLRGIVFFSLIMILLSMSLITRTQIRYWANSITLFQHSLKITKNNYIAHSNLGQAIIGRNDIPLENAAYHFAEAIRIKPDFFIAHLNLGVYWSSVGEYDKALYSYGKAIEYQPDDETAYTNSGNIYFKKGLYDLSLEMYLKAISINRHSHRAYTGIGAVYAKRKDFNRAALFFRRAIGLNPDCADAKANLSAITPLLKKNDPDFTNHK